MFVVLSYSEPPGLATYLYEYQSEAPVVHRDHKQSKRDVWSKQLVGNEAFETFARRDFSNFLPFFNSFLGEIQLSRELL